ncbi:NifB/NifX family molybdenum-iron cluster-binding protein [Psychromonas ossibalaenae]|uniref:NifB/NifX family molybdenum-iron cluster-binding protein n=1 Tax=Psychromonas ossibalaenae TaxID=444922 RepID=UPI000374DD71|nr:NifB/NifX family molybdenum-iron cluster-binding protein [Psychromonas ossibalaenae]
MKVALLTTQSRISPVFETALAWLIIEADPNECTIGSRQKFNTQNEVEMANELLVENIDLLICGAIPYYLEKILITQGCEVFSFTAGDVDQVIEALHLNQLDQPKFRMPGCQKRKQKEKKPFCRRTVNQ